MEKTDFSAWAWSPRASMNLWICNAYESLKRLNSDSFKSYPRLLLKKTPPLSLRSQNHSVILRYHHPLLEGASGVRLHRVRSNVDSQLCFCASKPYVQEISGDKLFCVCAAFKNDCFLILFQESRSTWWLLDNGNHVSVFHPWGNMGVEVQREWSGSRGGGRVWFVPTLQQSCQTVSALTRRSCATVGPQG